MDALREIYKDKRVLVTGGTGLIGRAVSDLLCELGARVTSVSLDKIYPDNRAIHLEGDLRDYTRCLEVTRNQDYVFHIAGIKASPAITSARPATMSVPALMVNTNVLEACRVNNVGKTLFTSSIGAYEQAELLTEANAYNGLPMDFLPGMVKRMAEYQIQGYAQEYQGNRFVIVRLANCYGPGDNFDPDNAMVIPSLMAKVNRGDNPVEIWGDGTVKRDFVYSEDVALGILQAMAFVNDTWPVNLSSGVEHSVREVIEQLSSFLNCNYVFDSTKPSGAARRCMDITRARAFGYDPVTTLREGLHKTWGWFISHPREYERRQNYFKERV